MRPQKKNAGGDDQLVFFFIWPKYEQAVRGYDKFAMMMNQVVFIVQESE